MRETKRAYGWPEDAQFLVPDGVYEHFADGHRRARARRSATAWEKLFAAYVRRRRPSSPPRSSAMQRRELPEGWDAEIPSFDADRQGDGDPQGLEQGRERDRRDACRGCSPARPTSPTRPRCA